MRVPATENFNKILYIYTKIFVCLFDICVKVAFDQNHVPAMDNYFNGKMSLWEIKLWCK